MPLSSESQTNGGDGVPQDGHHSENDGVVETFGKRLAGFILVAVSTIVLGVIGALIAPVIKDLLPAPGHCSNPEITINFPQDGQTLDSSVELAGIFACVPAGTNLWIAVMPPNDSYHGIFETDVSSDHSSFSAKIDFEAVSGTYRICTYTADQAAEQAFTGAVQQVSPPSLPKIPRTADEHSCVDVEVLYA